MLKLNWHVKTEECDKKPAERKQLKISKAIKRNKKEKYECAMGHSYTQIIQSNCKVYL